MGARERLGATVAIWAAFAITASITVGQITASVPIRTSELTLIGLVLVMAGAATLSTWAVWLTWRQEATPNTAKAKRAERRRLARLTEEMEAIQPDELDATVDSVSVREDADVVHSATEYPMKHRNDHGTGRD